MIAKSASSMSAKRTAILRAPGVGRDRDDARRPYKPRSRKWRAKSCCAVMWSTGIVKKPWIWPACRSIVSTRSAPATLDHVGDEARSRSARAASPCGPGAQYGNQRNHGRDALRRRELGRLDHEQQLHEVLVDGLAAGLDEEDVGAADRLAVATVGLAVRERRRARSRRARRRAARRFALRELRVRAAREHHQPLLRREGDGVARRHRHVRDVSPSRGPAASAQSSRFPPRPSLFDLLRPGDRQGARRYILRDHGAGCNPCVVADLTPGRRTHCRPQS